MPDDINRLNELEQRLNALEGRSGGGHGGGGGGQGGDANHELVQQYLQGALIANAVAHSQQQQQGVVTDAAPAFLSIAACGGGGGGLNPTQYDSVFWCRSRFACNPQSISCLC